jgi:hypothetical protein
MLADIAAIAYAMFFFSRAASASEAMIKMRA